MSDTGRILSRHRWLSTVRGLGFDTRSLSLLQVCISVVDNNETDHYI